MENSFKEYTGRSPHTQRELYREIKSSTDKHVSTVIILGDHLSRIYENEHVFFSIPVLSPQISN